MGVVTTIAGLCKRCYSCVRGCPAKAIKVEEGQAKVIEERCIACGSCVKACAQNAKQIQSGIEATFAMLGEEVPVYACLAPSFPAAFPELESGRLAGGLRALGFSKVMEVAYGAQLVVENGYLPLIHEGGMPVMITTPCPALVGYIEKYAPELVPFLAPVVSPMIALGRYIRAGHDGQLRLVFIGPCIAKKQEIRDPEVTGIIDQALTFKELKAMFQLAEIDPELCSPVPLDEPHPGIARIFPVSGGLLRTAALKADLLDDEIVVSEGKDRTLRLLGALQRKRLHARFLDLLLCEGCIDGPVMDNDLTVFARKEIITHYIRENQPRVDEVSAQSNCTVIPAPARSVSYRRTFSPGPVDRPMPSEERIREILVAIGRYGPDQELNCGMCGYDTCREKAVAVFQGLAENEMCLSYLIEKLQETQESLIQAEKMSALGQMAAGVAHEINNPLAGAVIYIQLLLKKLKRGEFSPNEFSGRLESIEKEINRCSRIIRNLLDFSRQTEPVFRQVDLNSVAEAALNLTSHQAQLAGVELTVALDRGIPRITADFDQMQQVIVNIIMNAIQAMPDGGTLAISTGWRPFEKIVQVVITDTGEGIPKEHLSKLFTPFFTTKAKGKGVGLGLAVAHGIVEKHKGRIEVHSEVDRGTTFIIKLGVHHG